MVSDFFIFICTKFKFPIGLVVVTLTAAQAVIIVQIGNVTLHHYFVANS